MSGQSSQEVVHPGLGSEPELAVGEAGHMPRAAVAGKRWDVPA